MASGLGFRAKALQRPEALTQNDYNLGDFEVEGRGVAWGGQPRVHVLKRIPRGLPSLSLTKALEFLEFWASWCRPGPKPYKLINVRIKWGGRIEGGSRELKGEFGV